MNTIAPALTQLFNLSVSTGCFPEDWKLAQVVPVPKSSDLSSSTSYRPISILSIISKILERHVHTIIYQHLCLHYPLSDKRWGFLPGRSTSSALLSVTHDWMSYLDESSDVCSIYFDLQKAFDNVAHSLLMQKLPDIDLDPYMYIVQWIGSYLSCRSQHVVVDGECSPV